MCKCKDYMKQGIILISVRDGEKGNNPYRTGGWCIVRDEVITRIVNSPELVESILKHRVSFISDIVWDQIGLSRENS